MGDAFAMWTAAAGPLADGIHQGFLGVLKAFGAVVVAWHAMRAGWGALTGNARRELYQALWQLALLGVIHEVVRDPRPVFATVVALVGGVFRFLLAPFAG